MQVLPKIAEILIKFYLYMQQFFRIKILNENCSIVYVDVRFLSPIGLCLEKRGRARHCL